MKRIFDLCAAFSGLLLTSPLMAIVLYLVWRQDGENPFYIAERTGKDEIPFKMYKLRSMIKNADKSGVDSTAASDMRITPVGHFIRRYKLDEISQLINVLLGDMSLVGPRPNVRRETDLYTPAEKFLLSVKPGITDFSSIVFADEGSILEGKEDPDLAYNQLIRPWKSRLGLFYIEKQSIFLDIRIILLTIVSIISRQHALTKVSSLLASLNATSELVAVSRRKNPLTPFAPPGTSQVVTSRVANN